MSRCLSWLVSSTTVSRLVDAPELSGLCAPESPASLAGMMVSSASSLLLYGCLSWPSGVSAGVIVCLFFFGMIGMLVVVMFDVGRSVVNRCYIRRFVVGRRSIFLCRQVLLIWQGRGRWLRAEQ